MVHYDRIRFPKGRIWLGLPPLYMFTASTEESIAAAARKTVPVKTHTTRENKWRKILQQSKSEEKKSTTSITVTKPS